MSAIALAGFTPCVTADRAECRLDRDANASLRQHGIAEQHRAAKRDLAVAPVEIEGAGRETVVGAAEILVDSRAFLRRHPPVEANNHGELPRLLACVQLDRQLEQHAAIDGEMHEAVVVGEVRRPFTVHQFAEHRRAQRAVRDGDLRAFSTARRKY
jgi:hypothetical protein